MNMFLFFTFFQKIISGNLLILFILLLFNLGRRLDFRTKVYISTNQPSNTKLIHTLIYMSNMAEFCPINTSNSCFIFQTTYHKNTSSLFLHVTKPAYVLIWIWQAIKITIGHTDRGKMVKWPIKISWMKTSPNLHQGHFLVS